MPKVQVTALLILAGFTSSANASTFGVDGESLREALDAMQVESLWLPGDTVDWQTGEPTGVPADGKKHSHCSAFVAAASERLGIYILRPPEHSSTLLANAQEAWLETSGAASGWQPVADDATAQQLANGGELVVVAFKSPDPKRPGHIAIVRPSSRDDASIADLGPEIIQAGITNYNATTVENGFKEHAGAWSNHEVRYFWHSLTWPTP